MGEKDKTNVLVGLVIVLLVAVVWQGATVWRLQQRLDPEIKRERIAERGQAFHATQARKETEDRDRNAAKETRPADPFADAHDLFDWSRDPWDPFKEMQSMQYRINRMFGGAFHRFEHSDDFGSLFGGLSYTPSIDIQDKGDHYLVIVDAPGLDDSRLDIKIEGRTLTLSGSVQAQTDRDDGPMLRRERRSGSFHRRVTLPGPVQAGGMTMEQDKGVLRIVLPKDHPVKNSEQ